MGVPGALAHMLLKTAIGSIIIWVVLVLLADIPTEKMPFLLLVILIANVIASGVATLILAWYRGY
jgi:hypothetical protein